MGTRSVVAVRHGDSWRGRYVHWDGYPSGVGQALWEIGNTEQFRDDRAPMFALLTQDHAGWSTITGEDSPKLGLGYDDGRFVAVPGIGVGYTSANIDDDYWIEADGDNGGAEWCYVMTPAGIHVLEGRRNGEHAVGMFGFNEGATWEIRAFVLWDDPETAMHLIERQRARF
jgi:catechol 2,3-dioxygenase-like lactoylglutathione lyase family enzyme